ncbi:MAG TPA: ATPase, T2SS/T4P/T4SS family [Pusillimonas sp.]|uniref:ATPase, T2SS/T4P/T4SS family n=1 Tax=Pusillimonas sp. TaxID=3040095 RepID=UPI002C56F7B4|nr:ATPase, T2SS/T4P/T4SS family [Pusillimonas sp.]HUH86990.1 ATPase, T2SS/T4P/T4SS family [Pusillimonas sp.]
MLELELKFEDGRVEQRKASLPLDIGRSPHCGLHIAAWRVGKQHARIERGSDGPFVDDLGTLGGTLVNGRRITHYGPLLPGDEILIGPCVIRVRRFEPASPAMLDATDGSADTAGNAHAMAQVSSDTRDEAQSAQMPCASDASNAPHRLSERLHHRRRLHRALVKALDLRRRDVVTLSDAALRDEALHVLSGLVQDDAELPIDIDRPSLLAEVVDEAVGLGPLEPLLADAAVTEIMVNRHDEVFVEIDGRLQRHPSGFSSEQAVLGVIERIVSPLGRRIDESSPMVDARLADGSRVNAVIPPIALRGASLTIRKFPTRRPGMDDLVRVGALDTAMRDFLTACVRHKKNIVVSGGTGSGKTTLLNVLSNCIPEAERIVTIEDAAELKLGHAHLVTLEARPPNLEGRGAVEIRDLVRNALRMRPDRIVVGECRGGEAFDMLAAMNTGHEGSLTTLHANSPRDALARLETMILMAGMDLPLAAVREHIGSSIDLIVQQVRASDGRRYIDAIVEVTGIESGRIQLQPLFSYQPGPPAAFVGCGVMPDFLARAHQHAGVIDASLFNQRNLLPSVQVGLAQVASGSPGAGPGPESTGGGAR